MYPSSSLTEGSENWSCKRRPVLELRKGGREERDFSIEAEGPFKGRVRACEGREGTRQAPHSRLLSPSAAALVAIKTSAEADF